jgi:hypothetical protein
MIVSMMAPDSVMTWSPTVTVGATGITAGGTGAVNLSASGGGIGKPVDPAELPGTIAGSTVTLPAATGSGCKFRFEVTVLATSNSHIVKVANASDTMRGGGVIADTDTAGAAYSFFAAAASDTITLNRSTTGSVSLGEWIEVTDAAANRWTVDFCLSGTGTPLTPFSATV